MYSSLQNEVNLQTLNKAQQKLTADQNQLLMAGGKLEQQAQVRILRLTTAFYHLVTY